MASFNLQCIICPNDPTFSDVSHLLTHIGSKGHLSHYFKTQVRSRQDVQAQTKIQSYDRWYLDNDIEQLLSQRMNSKEPKPRSRKSQSKRARSSKDDTIDPNLSLEQPITSPRHVSRRSPLQSHSNPPKIILKSEVCATTIDDDGISESSVLKGIIWPGMDLFDSASPEAKKMRNQKKHLSVLSKMETNSGLVEPTEVIYFPSWEIKTERFISGDVESSPEVEPAPKPKRRYSSRNKKLPLGDVDTNVHRVENRRHIQTSAASVENRRHTQTFPASVKSGAEVKARTQKLIAPTKDGIESDRSSLGYPDTNILPTVSRIIKSERNIPSAFEDPDLDWNLTIGRPGQKKRRGFEVHRDADLVAPDKDAGIQRLASPSIARATSGTSFHGSSRGTINFPYSVGNAGYARGLFNAPVQISNRLDVVNMSNGKENMEPIIDSLGRIDGMSTLYANEGFSRRHLPTAQAHNHAFPPRGFAFPHQRYHTQSTNPLMLYSRPQTGLNRFGINYPAQRRPNQPADDSFQRLDHHKADKGDSSGDETIEQEIEDERKYPSVKSVVGLR